MKYVRILLLHPSLVVLLCTTTESEITYDKAKKAVIIQCHKKIK